VVRKVLLDELLSKFNALPDEQKAAATEILLSKTGSMPWVPNPGPQTEAFYCLADETFYGGQEGRRAVERRTWLSVSP
jgi:hypothetical protein